MSTSATATPVAIGSEGTRWVNLIFCIVCMVMIANLQYGWMLFANPSRESRRRQQ